MNWLAVLGGFIGSLVGGWIAYRVGYQDGYSAMEKVAREYAPNKFKET